MTIHVPLWLLILAGIPLALWILAMLGVVAVVVAGMANDAERATRAVTARALEKTDSRSPSQVARE
jgi:hypothetical protein